MKKVTLILSFFFVLNSVSAQKKMLNQNDKQKNKATEKTVVIPCTEFHVTRPLTEIAAEFPVDENAIHKKEKESEDREGRTPQKFPKTAEKDGPAYGNDPSGIQDKMGEVPAKAPIMNFAGQTATSGIRPFDPSGAVGPSHYVQAINSTTFKVYNKSTGATMLTASVGSLWTPATPNDGDPIVMYDKAADRWFISQFGTSGNKIYIAISQTNNPTGAYYTYTFTSPAFPDYLKFGVWQDGYYMTSNQAQKVFCFERTAMLAGSPTARSLYTSFSPPQGSGFFVPMPGDAADGVLPPAGTPCPIFSYSDNGWGGSFTDAVNIYKMTVNWVPTTPTATITSAGTVPTAAFDASYSASWDDCSQPGTTQKLDGIGGIIMYRAQWKTWTGYNSVVLNWAVRISATQRSIKWCELRQNQSTGVWSMYQQGIYTPDAATRWMGGIAMDNNGAIALCYLKSDATSIYPGLYYTGRRPCDPLGTMPVTESVAIAGTGSQTGGINRDGDYSQVVLDGDGVTFWCTSEYMGGATGGSAARTRIFSFQLPTCGAAAPVADFIADNTTPCIGATVNFTDLSTNTPTSWAWSFSPTTVTYTGGTTSASQHPKVQFNAAGPYTVTLVATNVTGSNTMVKTAYINPVTAGALPLVENFEGATFPPTGWTVVNNDAPTIAWGTAGAKGLVRRPALGNTGSTSGSAGIELYNYNTDTMQVDELISTPVSLIGATAPRMTFKRAYKYYNDGTSPNNYHDELRVFISTDCGATYGSAVYYKKGVQLATNGTLNTTFTPGVTADWDIDTVNLTSYVGQNIYVKFQITNRYGNNLYLDDVNINSTAAAVASVSIASNDADNTICAGASVTFTATPTNGGTAPTYQWQVNGSNVGTNSPTYTTTALTNGQIITCIMTSNLAGVTGSPATSNSITMTVNPVPSAPIAGSNSPVCVGSAINLTATTVAGATYAWTGPSTFTSATQNPSRPSATAAMAGTYSVTATVNGCSSAAATTTVVVNTAPVATFSYTGSPYCSTAANPSPTFSGGGTAGTFTASAGLVFVSASTGQVNLASSTPGTYTVTNTKAASGGCPAVAATASITINSPSVAAFSYAASPYCKTAANPSPSFSGGGIAGTFTSSAGLVFVSAATGQVNLASSTAGTYTVTNTIAASGGCAAVTATNTIVINPTPVIAAESNVTVCAGASVAANTFTSTPTGATYAWTNSNTAIGLAANGTTSTPAFTATNTTASPIVATITVTPTLAGCSGTPITYTITVNPLPTSTYTQSANQCLTGNSFNFTNTGSTGTYSWTFTGGTPASSTSNNPTGITFATAGSHAITHVVTSAAGCSSTSNTTVTVYANPTAQATTTTTTACGASTGTITIGATTGGTSPYTYSVNGSAFTTTTAYSGFGAGSYPVIVQDVNGCQFSTTAVISNSSGPTAQSVSTINATCGGSNGTINIGATTGGTGPYTYSVNGSAYTTATTYTGLAAGAYSVIVKDVAGCMFTTNVNVSNTPGPTAQATTITNATCGNSNGVINLGATTGGAAAYTFSLNGSAFTSATNYTGLAAGTYTVVVKDANACTFSTVVTVANSAGPTAVATSTSNSNCGNSDGTITIGAVTGGSPAYTYSVNGSASTTATSYTGFTAGTYPVVVSDANGCTFSTTVTVSNTGSTPPTPTITQSGLILTSSSATGNQWYLDGVLIPGATGQNYTVSANGNYTVVVTIAGCPSATSAVTVVTGVGINEIRNNPYGLSVYPNPNDGNFTISFVSNDKNNYKVEIVNALGQLVYREDVKDFTGMYKKEMSVVEYGQGVYTISLTNSKNETVKKIVVY
jgi:PKD repeat protein